MAASQPSQPTAPVKRLPRAERLELTLDAATRTFARAGFDATGLDYVAAEAGISKVLLYRLFESKTDLYRAVLNRACTRLRTRVGDDDFTDTSIPALLDAAADDPDGFRLVFRHAAREPKFREFADDLAATSHEVALKHLSAMIPDPHWANWAARLIPAATIEAVITWLDAGQPDPDTAADRVGAAAHGIIAAAQLGSTTAELRAHERAQDPTSRRRRQASSSV